MNKILQFRDIINLWPSKAELARDCDVEYGAVNQWDRRNYIPDNHWKKLILSAKKRGFLAVTSDLLTDLSSKK